MRSIRRIGVVSQDDSGNRGRQRDGWMDGWKGWMDGVVDGRWMDEKEGFRGCWLWSEGVMARWVGD